MNKIFGQFFRASILILIFVFSASSIAETLSLQQTVEINRLASAYVSPNGKYVAFTKIVPRKIYKDTPGKAYVELHISDLNGNSKGYVLGKERVGNIVWGPNSQFIYFIAQRQMDKYVSIYRINVNGGEAKRVTNSQRDISAFVINHDGKALTYLAKSKISSSAKKANEFGFNAEVYEESNENSHAFLVALSEPNSVHFKLSIKEHILALQYHPKNNAILAKVAPTSLVNDRFTASQYNLYQQDGKLIRKIKTVGKLSYASWSNDGEYIAFIGAKDKADPRPGRLFVADATTGRVSQLIHHYPGHIKSFRWLPNNRILFLGHVGTKSEISIIDIATQSIEEIFHNEDEVFTSIDVDRSGEVLVGIASSDKHPKELFNITNKKAERMTNLNPWLDGLEKPKQVSITYKARDGVEIEGVLIYPMDYKKRKRYPLIMMVHGGPESHVSDGWIDSYSFPIKYAASKGFMIFLPNYRGSTGKGVAFSKLGQADYAGAEFNDLVDAITFLSKSKLIDRKRVGITGASYGGYASAWAATALTEYFSASVMSSGIADQISKYGTSDIPQELFNVHARSYPWEDWQWMLERSPIYYSGQSKTPLLIIRGEKDTRVHPSQSLELYRYIKDRTNTPVRLVTYPDEGHGNQKTVAKFDFSIRLMRWMEFYLQDKNRGGDKMPPWEIDYLM